MKTYILRLNLGWTVYLDADGFIESGNQVQFYLGSPDVPIAVYARPSLSSMSEAEPSTLPRSALFEIQDATPRP